MRVLASPATVGVTDDRVLRVGDRVDGGDPIAIILGIATELELESMDPALALPFHERLHAGGLTERHRDVQRKTFLEDATEQHRDRLVRDAPEDVPAGDIDGALRVS